MINYNEVYKLLRNNFPYLEVTRIKSGHKVVGLTMGDVAQVASKPKRKKVNVNKPKKVES